MSSILRFLVRGLSLASEYFVSFLSRLLDWLQAMLVWLCEKLGCAAKSLLPSERGSFPAYVSLYFVVAVIFMAFWKGQEHTTVISPFHLPHRTSLPFGEYTVANFLSDALVGIINEAKTEQPVPSVGSSLPEQFPGRETVGESTNYEPSTRSAVEVKGVSLEGLVSLARKILGRERAISGDVVLATKGFQLVVRAKDAGPWKSRGAQLTAEELEQACQQVALRMLGDFDPTLLGIYLTRKGRYDDAIKLYHRALHVNPRDADALNGLGIALRNKCHLDDAIASYNQALGIKPNFPEALHNLGIALAHKDQFGQAIEAYRKALQIRPDFPNALANLGRNLETVGKIDEAIAAWREALQLDPENTAALTNLGTNFFARGNHAESLVRYEKAVLFEPQSPIHQSNLGTARLAMGQFDEAIASYKKAVGLAPDMAPIHNNLGAAFAEKGQLDNAIAAYQEALKLNRDYPEAFYNLGKALFEKGDLDQAITAYERALQLKPNYAEALNNLGGALDGKGNYNAALEAVRRSLELEPENTRVLHPDFRFETPKLTLY